jgi:hypothetical protein
MTAPYQSKLIPHEDFIRQCRAKRWSYVDLNITQAMKPSSRGGQFLSRLFPWLRGPGSRRAALLPSQKRVTPSAFRGGNLCRVLFPAQGRRGPGNKTRGMTAPVGRRLRTGGVWLVLRGCSVVHAAPTSRGCAPLPRRASRVLAVYCDKERLLRFLYKMEYRRS